jgi:hypothetical protein
MTKLFIAFVIVALIAAGAGMYAMRTTGQEKPEGLAEPTATPDTRFTQDPAQARNELGQADPELARLIDAIQARDVELIFSLVDWREEECGVRRDVHCGNAKNGNHVQVVNVSGVGPAFYVPAEVLRPSLEQALAGKPLELRFAARSKERPELYTLGFDGMEVKGKGLEPLHDSSSNITGLFFTLDISRERPIVLIEQVDDQYRATKRGSEFGYQSQQLIVFDPIDPEPDAP